MMVFLYNKYADRIKSSSFSINFSFLNFMDSNNLIKLFLAFNSSIYSGFNNSSFSGILNYNFCFNICDFNRRSFIDFFCEMLLFSFVKIINYIFFIYLKYTFFTYHSLKINKIKTYFIKW